MAGDSGAMEYSPSTFWTAPARNFRTSARLHLQHLLFQNTLGFLLEPKVESATESSKSLKIADLACGNGVWLCDLERELSGKTISAQLDGFDVNPVNFPAPPLLPQSVTLKKLDMFAQPLPDDLIGTYDVVHFRAVCSLITHSNLTPLLSVALALLKPGGWLQWEETRVDMNQADALSLNVNKSACDTIISLLDAGGKAIGTTFEYLGELDRHLEENGLKEVELRQFEKRRVDLKAWTEDYLMVWEELAVLFPSKATAPQAPMTRESYVQLFEKAVSETEQGVVVHQGKVVVVVGRKAS